MQIWVDADACPQAIKDILYRTARRLAVRVTLVANRPLAVPRSPHIGAVHVARGFDVADRHIADRVEPGDVVVTGDVPLAAQVVERGAHAIGPRGEEFTAENVAEKLATRDLMDELRSAGLQTGGPAAHGDANRQAFANALDRLLTRLRG